MHAPRIAARGWGWRWNGRRAWAVRGLDLDVAPGERVLLLGPSGAGKSTLLAGVAGLLDAGEDGSGEQEGQLLLDGAPAGRARLDAVAGRAGEARTGLLLQDPQAQTVLARVGDDVAFGLENHRVPPEAIWPRVDGALAAVDLPLPRRHPTSRLSGGQRQRLALAGVLALRPGLLLLDEPTAMLDPDGARRLRAVVGEQLRATGGGCLLVEHRVDLWLDLVDRVVVLAPGGGALADGPPERVLAERAAELAAAGVWLPGRSAAPLRPTASPGAASPAQVRATPPEEPLLALEEVAVGRRGGAPVLSGVDAGVTAGRVVAVRGPNGAGKSTLALALAGLVAPVSGRVRATPALAAGAGEEPVRWRARQLVTRIGSVFQDPRHQFVAGTVAEELAVGPRRAGAPEADVAARVAALLERLHLQHLARAHPFTLSGGEQRRLSVATALATRPRLLVLDEPTFGQDARTWAQLVRLLREVRDEGAAVVAATHDADLTAALADEVWAVADGRVRTRLPAGAAR
ncbi:ABC transporter ATP-binding protein [Quadrisphaera sp. DSM 44207]|uniref:ABC transporter ATP-binding protein n=1 Tax=Quadrisphaera sp. DSM 44207 TaxID=1881057 RepID=UPI00088D4B22|nr:ABC transporter ATP-binding protein [Quadrisphaera sp. DSM 44207]SDQ88415.1 energy-coupling factor transport system ATP-binding protein [Quadrisphaera sp. DSM 44207]